MIGFEKDFLCHFHLGSIWISLLFSFLSEPFFRNDKESGTLELYYLSAYCLPKILLLQLVGHRVIQISRVFCAFPMLQLPYQFDRSGMDRLNILLGSPVLTLLCGIHSRLALGVTSSSGWNSLQNPTTSPTLLPPTVFCTSIETEGFHVLLLIGYFSLFVSLYPILVSISSQD
jgi:heme exporter protein CcmB